MDGTSAIYYGRGNETPIIVFGSLTEGNYKKSNNGRKNRNQTVHND